jgi:hypothetical protein
VCDTAKAPAIHVHDLHVTQLRNGGVARPGSRPSRVERRKCSKALARRNGRRTPGDDPRGYAPGPETSMERFLGELGVFTLVQAICP